MNLWKQSQQFLLKSISNNVMQYVCSSRGAIYCKSTYKHNAYQPVAIFPKWAPAIPWCSSVTVNSVSWNKINCSLIHAKAWAVAIWQMKNELCIDNTFTHSNRRDSVSLCFIEIISFYFLIYWVFFCHFFFSFDDSFYSWDYLFVSGNSQCLRAKIHANVIN